MLSTQEFLEFVLLFLLIQTRNRRTFCCLHCHCPYFLLKGPITWRISAQLTRLKFQTSFWKKSSENQIVNYMERDSARAENPSPVCSNQARIFSPAKLAWKSGKVSCNRNGISARAEKGTWACTLTVFWHLSKFSHRNLCFAPRLKLNV